MRFFILVSALAWACFPYLGEAQDVTSTDIMQMITELKAAVPECAVNIRHQQLLELLLT